MKVETRGPVIMLSCSFLSFLLFIIDESKDDRVILRSIQLDVGQLLQRDDLCSNRLPDSNRKPFVSSETG